MKWLLGTAFIVFAYKRFEFGGSRRNGEIKGINPLDLIVNEHMAEMRGINPFDWAVDRCLEEMKGIDYFHFAGSGSSRL